MSDELLKTIVWAGVVLIVFILFLICFHKQIKLVIERISSFEFKGFKASSQINEVNKSLEKQVQADIDSLHDSDIEWDKVGNIFWLSHDLMWTIDKIIRNPKREDIAHGLSQISFHLSEIHLQDTFLAKRVEALLKNANNSLLTDWDMKMRQDYVNEIYQIVMGIAKIFEEHQEDFQPRPK